MMHGRDAVTSDVLRLRTSELMRLSNLCGELQLLSSLAMPKLSMLIVEKEDRHNPFHGFTLICPSLIAVDLCLLTLIVP